MLNSIRKTSEAAKAVVALAALAAVAGCAKEADELAVVRGQVLLDGKPLTIGRVLTLPESGRGAQGVIDGEGRFKLDSGALGTGATVGVHRAAVVAAEEPEGLNPEAPRKLLVPRKYTNPNRSGLTIDVQPGQVNEVTLQLSSTDG